MKNVRNFAYMLVIGVILAGFSQPVFAQKVTKKNVPAAVISAFEKSFPTAKVKGYSREKEGDKISYEIECMVGSVHHDVSYNADGSLVVDEETIRVEESPEAVKKAIQTAYPQGKIQLAEKLTTGSEIKYEFIVKTGKKTQEVEFDASGKVVNTEDKTGKPEKD